MSILRKVAHNTAAQIVGKMISTALGLVALGMLTRYLPPEQFGWYVTVIAFLQFVGIMIDFGLVPVSAQLLSQPNIDLDKMVKNLIAFRFTTALLLLGITPMIALFFPYPAEVKIAIAFTTIQFLAIAMNQVMLGYHQSQLRVHIQAVGEIVGRVGLVGGLWLLMVGNASFLWIMVAVNIGSVLYTAVTIGSLIQDGHFGLRFDWPVWKEITVRGWPIAVSILFNVAYVKGDTILLTLFRDQTEVANYGAAYKIVDVLAQSAMMFMGIMLPLMAAAWARNKKKLFEEHLQQSVDIMMLLAVPMTIGILMLADPIMLLIAGAGYDQAGTALQILALAVFGVYLGGIFGHAVVAINKQKAVLPIYIANSIITVIGYLIFIPRFGFYGAAWMTVFSELFAGTALAMFVWWHSRARLSITRVASIFFSGLVMAAVISLLPAWHVLIQVSIGALVFVFMVLALGVVSVETIREVVRVQVRSSKIEARS